MIRKRRFIVFIWHERPKNKKCTRRSASWRHFGNSTTRQCSHRVLLRSPQHGPLSNRRWDHQPVRLIARLSHIIISFSVIALSEVINSDIEGRSPVTSHIRSGFGHSTPNNPNVAGFQGTLPTPIFEGKRNYKNFTSLRKLGQEVGERERLWWSKLSSVMLRRCWWILPGSRGCLFAASEGLSWDVSLSSWMSQLLSKIEGLLGEDMRRLLNLDILRLIGEISYLNAVKSWLFRWRWPPARNMLLRRYGVTGEEGCVVVVVELLSVDPRRAHIGAEVEIAKWNSGQHKTQCTPAIY